MLTAKIARFAKGKETEKKSIACQERETVLLKLSSIYSWLTLDIKSITLL